MTLSMTGFATRRGQLGPHSWVWDIRSVNGKGLDLRLRLPDWIDGLEAPLRTAVGKALNRGNVNLTLKVSRSGAEESSLRLNAGALRTVLVMLAEVEQQAMTTGVTLAQASQADVLALRGVLETGSETEDTAPLAAALVADFADLLADLQAMRAVEGRALQALVQEQLAQIDALLRDASQEAAARQEQVAATLKDNVKKLMQWSDKMDENRTYQELAMIAVKSDVTEELDRLRAHVDAARALIVSAEPVGRKLDFLMQEFMREANTLCSKAQALALTRVGLDLKTVIDQMREQVQNVE